MKITKIQIKLIQKNGIKAVFNVTFDYCLTINGILLIDSKQGGEYFLQFPQKEYVDKEGETKYQKYVYADKSFNEYLNDRLLNDYLAKCNSPTTD